MNIITQQPIDCDAVYPSPDHIFEDDRYCAQEKINGVKVIIFSDRGNLTGISRSGRPIKLSAKTRAMMPVQGTFIIEGEQGNKLTGDTGFVAFDVLSANRQDVRHMEYDDRLQVLALLGVPVIQTVLGTAEKRRLHVEVFAKGGEGLVFKHLGATYHPGKTVKQLKLKNWKSDTFRVVAVDGKGIELETLTGKPAGRCPGFAAQGQLVEVRFQDITAAGKLCCPIFEGIRDDL